MTIDPAPFSNPREESKPGKLDFPLSKFIPWNLETFLVIIIIALAIVSRFDNLGARVLSHDEINHVIPSYDYYTGNGYHYDPMSHGPLQYHLVALSFFLFGDNDFSFRIPAALFSVATILIALLAFRKYLGKVGALAAGVMFLISPYMLFYGRYQRNEAFIVVWGILTIYSILRYLETGHKRFLVLFTVINALHFIDKSTSYIFAAEELIFFAGYLFDRLLSKPWVDGKAKRLFLLHIAGMLISAVLIGLLYYIFKPQGSVLLRMSILGVFVIVFAVQAFRAFSKGLGWQAVREERVFDLAMLLGTMILPLLAALPIKMAGFDPLDYTTAGITRALIVIGILALVAIAFGLWWGRTKWLLYALIFYGIFVLFYSTFFTNTVGVPMGFMGALGYWMQQQAVNRGSQPLYYYALLQIPIYEFLPAFGTILAIIVVWKKKLWQTRSMDPFTPQSRDENGQAPVPVMALILFWTVTSLTAFTMAGEKMPWLTIHIALPMILASGWFVGWLAQWRSGLALPALNWKQVARYGVSAILVILVILTVRTSYRAAFINYDYPLEYLVYAHAADGPMILLKQIEEISQRTTGGMDIVVAYDNNVRYPYWWYMRHFPNRIDFGTEPTRDLSRAAVIVVSDQLYGKIAPVVKDNYVQFDFMRMWWPNQDYMTLKWDNIAAERTAVEGVNAPPMSILDYSKYAWKHISPFFTDPQVRSAIWQIWFNRDYTEYAKLKNSNAFTLENWNTGSRMRAYIRKDVASLMWGFKTTETAAVVTDPYQKVQISLNPDLMIGQTGSATSQFQSPRSLAVAPNGTIYVADSRNNRIQHFTAKGEFLNSWGRFADVATGNAPGGTFNEPWGVAVGPDGSVYVSDTWNYRVQKFSPNGDFITMWGTNGFADNPLAFYGPRGIAVDQSGRVLVVDTGNKRVVIFNKDGKYLAQYGTPGLDNGQLDEPVGIAIDRTGLVYLTDTWNQRVQVFSPDPTGLVYTFVRAWEVNAWFGQSLENKPFIAVDQGQNVFISDPEGCRVIEFSSIGEPKKAWGDCGIAQNQFSLPVGLAVDPSGGLWVSDAGDNNRLVHFPATLFH